MINGNLYLKRDRNGNKIIAIKPHGERGFSIQTNGNLPRTNRMTRDTIDSFIASNEIYAYVKKYGTKRQKEVLAL